MVRHLEDESQLWQPKHGRRQEKRPQNEQEAEVDDAEKAAVQEATVDTEPQNSQSASSFAKQSDFY